MGGIPTLAAGTSTDIFVLWTPTANLTSAQLASRHFKFHSCIQVIIEPGSGEIITSDNQAQENFDDFEAVLGLRKRYSPVHGQFFVHRRNVEGPPQTFYLNVNSDLPRGWKYSVAQGQQAITLGPGQTVQVPVDIQVPAGTAVGQAYMLSVQALTLLR